MSESPATLRERQARFLEEDYKLKIDYLTRHFDRMWRRFDFFIGIETALFVALFALFRDGGDFGNNAAFIAAIGMVSSLLWYVFGAQDRYLVVVYRRQVKQAGELVAREYSLSDYLGSAYVSVSATDQPPISWRLYQWRIDAISATKLAAWFPLVVLIFWIVIVIAIVA